jgi:exosortase/archaeosortase family protein
MADTFVLNARIRRTSRRPGAEPADEPATPGSDAPVQQRRVVLLLAALLAALWPHWLWMVRRLTDGSDEPWGVLALATALVLVAREWRTLVVPSRRVLALSATLAVAAAALRGFVPPLLAATLAMAAVAAFLAGARPTRRALPLATLLLLALPIIASLQFYAGYPLRAATAALAAPLLQLVGVAAQAQGAALVHDGRVVLVDPPCAGIGMLWVGAYTAALLSHLADAPARHALRNAFVAAASVFAANVLRNIALFFPEGLDLQWPAWAHPAIGLAAFTLALLPIALVATRRPAQRSGPDAPWPPRFHRHVV